MSNFTPEQIQEILDLYFENFAHHQYIGARYVPIFGRKGETSIEWDNSAPYEPLTIVLHEGNSYTSRQFVPTGIAITNNAYWAETGNFNAQVEQYRQEVLAIDGRVTNVESDISGITADSWVTTNRIADHAVTSSKLASGLVSSAFVGNYGAVEKDSSIDWQSIIDEIAEQSDTIDFGSGVWYFASAIDIPANIVYVVGNGAIIEPTSLVTHVFRRVEQVTAGQYSTHFNGLFFRCNSLADKCIVIENHNSCEITDCTFENFITVAVDASNKMGCNVVNSIFRQKSISPLRQNTGIGVITGTDARITSCRFFRLGTAVETSSTTEISNCYFYANPKDYNVEAYGITAVDYTNGNKIERVTVTNCEFDCITKCFVNIEKLIVSHNNFYWNDAEPYNGANYIFFINNDDLDLTIAHIEFNNNILKLNDNIYFDVYSFGSDSNTKGMFQNYHSVGNIMPFGVNNVPNKVHITAGFATKAAMPENTDIGGGIRYTKFTPLHTNPTSINGFGCLIKQDIYNAVFSSNNSATLNFYRVTNKPYTQHVAKAVFQTTPLTAPLAPFYIAGRFDSFNEVWIDNGCYNMEQSVITTVPSGDVTVTAEIVAS